jgi:hypothetical protein
MSNEKIEQFWQDATADDVARVMAGETVEARFRDEDSETWKDGEFLGGCKAYRTRRIRFIDLDGVFWEQCQVYREPSWYANKPDPGPGYRLLGKLPDEPKLGTDECWNPSERKWQQVKNDDGIQEYQAWYRRRIEAVEPEPKHYVLRVGDSFETPRGHLIEVVSLSDEQGTYSLDAGDKLTLPNGQTITITAKGFEVTQ